MELSRRHQRILSLRQLASGFQSITAALDTQLSNKCLHSNSPWPYPFPPISSQNIHSLFLLKSVLPWTLVLWLKHILGLKQLGFVCLFK